MIISKSKFCLIDVKSILEYFHNIIAKSPNLKLPSLKLSVTNDVIKKTLLIESEKFTVNNFKLTSLNAKFVFLLEKLMTTQGFKNVNIHH